MVRPVPCVDEAVFQRSADVFAPPARGILDNLPWEVAYVIASLVLSFPNQMLASSLDDVDLVSRLDGQLALLNISLLGLNDNRNCLS